MRSTSLAVVILAGSIASTLAETYTSATSGNWNATDIATWNPQGNPQTGSVDSVSILTGHTVIFTGTSPVGLPGSNDLGVAGGQSITLNGGILSQTPPNYWIRIGHETDGTLNINNGSFFFTNSTAAASPNLQIGVRGANGFVNIGDGIGTPGTAVLNLRDIIDGTENGAGVSMNLGAAEGTFTAGRAGTVVIKADGVLEGDARTQVTPETLINPIIRVGQAPTEDRAQSAIIVDGGLFNARGTVEIGSQPNTATGGRANGLIRLDNGGRMVQTAGEFNIGFWGDALFVIEDNGVYSKLNDPTNRGDILIGREATAVGTVTVGSGGQFIRGEGGNVGDLRIGLRGTGVMTINAGGLVENSSSNWDWVGQDAGSNGTLTVNTGGTFRATAIGSPNLNVGVNAGATGLVTINGGTLELLNSANSQLRLAQNGTGTYRQISGSTNVQAVTMAENDGVATFDLQGGEFNSRSSFFMGGASATSAGAGTATGTQSGGTLNVGGPFVVGLATGHTAVYTQTGGVINHTGSDVSVGESGVGTMTIGTGGTFNNTSGGSFFVGRNDGSDGTLFVNGTLTNLSFNPIRVGNGNTLGNDNTTGTGLLGGTGTIDAAGGVHVGTQGTLTGGTLETVGTLGITGPLAFSPDGTFFANFAAGNADRLTLTGTADVTGALLDGTWGTGGVTGPSSRYWLLVNDETDSIVGTFANMSLTGSAPLQFPNADGWVTIGGQEFAVNYSADFASNSLVGGNDLLLRAVPEPSTAVMLGTMLCLAFCRRRRSAKVS